MVRFQSVYKDEQWIRLPHWNLRAALHQEFTIERLQYGSVGNIKLLKLGPGQPITGSSIKLDKKTYNRDSMGAVYWADAEECYCHAYIVFYASYITNPVAIYHRRM